MIQKIIKRWPLPRYHMRNIKIAKEVARGRSYKKVGNEYGISGQRVSQIYRLVMAYLCEQHFSIPWHEAVYIKKYYKHEDALEMIIAYEHFYILSWSTEQGHKP